jgi:hypothetical protein
VIDVASTDHYLLWSFFSIRNRLYVASDAPKLKRRETQDAAMAVIFQRAVRDEYKSIQVIEGS